MLGTVAHSVTGDSTSATALTSGYATGMVTAAGLLVVAALIGLLMLPRESPSADAAEEPVEAVAR